jgi:energy-coupling factor transport system permease protein
LSPELRILSYIIFIVFLFLIKNLYLYLFICIVISGLLFLIPFRHVKSGWVPISLFLVFTFLGNVLFQHGKILYHAGPLLITQEGLNMASIRTFRVFFMIAGAKILAATTKVELLVNALGKMLNPLERLGIPVGEFFSMMGLTMKTLPKLKEHIAVAYKEKVRDGNITGFLDRARVISLFLVPLFVKSMQSPEIFFKDGSDSEKNN